MRLLIVLLILCACSDKSQKDTEHEDIALEQMAFDKIKWGEKVDQEYTFRDKMLHEVVYTDTIRQLKKAEVLDLLGEPDVDRDHEDYLYYTISQKKLGIFPMKTKMLVIKLQADTVEWIKIHE